MSETDSVLFNVDINNYNGPLDVLLDLAKAQKVDLEEISITKLADQFHEYITNEKHLNLEIASEYLLIATWLAYLKSKLLLPGTPEEEFKVQEVAEKLKLQLKKLELIRLLSEQMLKRNRLGREIRTRGIKGNIRSIYSSEYNVNLFELLKAYSSVVMTKDFQTMSIPKLPVFTTEDGIKTIKQFLGKLMDWKNINDLIPKNFKNGSKYKRTGKAGIFAGSLELVKEGNLSIKQDNLFELLKTYSTIIMTKDFQKMDIPKLPVFTTEEGIKTIKEFFGKLVYWKKLDDLIPKNFKRGSRYKRTGKAGIFAGSLELVKEGNLKIKQEELFEEIYIKENK